MSSADLAVRPAPTLVYRGTLRRQVRSELRLVFRRRRNESWYPSQSIPVQKPFVHSTFSMAG